MPPGDGQRLDLTKHHGAGNDFLVVLDPDDHLRLSAAEVRALCDRRLGVGADGVIVVAAGREGTQLTMDLRNADGSGAEMSGNGIRCLAQAAVDGGMVAAATFAVATPAGVRTVAFRRGVRQGEDWASVDMGQAVLGPEPGTAAWDGPTRLVDVGNPHLVVLAPDPAAVDLPVEGPRLQASADGGVNVEFIALGEPDELVLRVWERGVGETLACGTGSVAAAAAAAAWGLVGPTVRVRNPGGTLEVELGGEGEPDRLAGPVRKVANVTVDRSALA
jgi:diaminopimelate epimerase